MPSPEGRPVYLDHHSSTPLDPRVLEAMLPFLRDNCANPANQYHPWGQAAAAAVEAARQRVAELLGARPGQVIFTSGATEANNLAILGAAAAAPAGRRTVITTAVEHKSVLEPCQRLAERGFVLRVLPVDPLGHVLPGALAEALDQSVLLVSIQLANNEIGTIQRVAELAPGVRACGALLHTDGAQAVGKIPVDVGRLGVDLLSFSAHKLYGPKGVGGLYVGPRARRGLAPLCYGGGQELGLRPGTLNVPGVVGLGEACRLAGEELEEEGRRVGALRNRLEAALLEQLEGVRRNGDPGARLPNASSLTFEGVDADALLLNLPDVALSTGSACTAGTIAPSHVLTAVGLEREEAYRTVRIGLGRFTTREEVDVAVERIVGAVRRIRALG